MIMLLKHESEIVAVLAALDSGVTLIDAHPCYKPNLERYLKRGINFEERIPLSKFNCDPSLGREFLEKLASFYQATLNLSSVKWEK